MKSEPGGQERAHVGDELPDLAGDLEGRSAFSASFETSLSGVATRTRSPRDGVAVGRDDLVVRDVRAVGEPVGQRHPQRGGGGLRRVVLVDPLALRVEHLQPAQVGRDALAELDRDAGGRRREAFTVGRVGRRDDRVGVGDPGRSDDRKARR
jgi:hypothetical protein